MTMSERYPFHKSNRIVLDHHQGRRFILWLSCGHSGGMGEAGAVVTTRKCHHCGNGYKQVIRVEPCDGR
jgi:hypothetical protein